MALLRLPTLQYEQKLGKLGKAEKIRKLVGV